MSKNARNSRIEFTDLISLSGNLARYSPTGRLLAVAYTNKIIIRASDSLAVSTILTTIDKITSFSWSSDSSLILAVLSTRSKVQVFDLTNPKWECTIDAGLVGVDQAYFSPDGRHIICAAEFNIVLTVFSLVDKSVKTIEWPKNPKECLKFTDDGGLAIIGERKNYKDAISIVSLREWTLDSHFETDTEDFQMIRLNNHGSVIALVDPLPHPQILVYFITGEKKACIKSGTTCCWSPTTQFLAIPSLTEVVLFNNLTWTKTTSFSPLVNEANIVYEEHGPKFHLSQTNFNKYLENPEPTEITRAKFSPTNKYLAAVQGRSIQIYKIESLKLLSVIFLKSDVKAVEWSPIKDELLATANNSNVYMWSESGAMIIQIPHANFNAKQLIWSNAGKSFILLGKDKCSVAYLDCPAALNSEKENIPTDQMKHLNIIN